MPSRPNRPARRTAALVALAAAAALLAAAPSRSDASPRRALPPQGLYEGCAPGSEGGACAARLARIRFAGFRYVLNYSSWYGSPAEVLRYADAAAALGLKLIWPLNHPAWRGLGSLAATYSSFAEVPGGSEPVASGESRQPVDDAELTARAIGLVAAHPATWGFYIGDELPAAEADRVRALSATVRALAPDKPQLYVARPGAAQLEPFVSFADVAGADSYPVGSADPSVAAAARSARAVTSEAGVRTAIVLQAFSWSQYRPAGGVPRYPGERALRAMRDAAIRHADPSLILWYSYQDIVRSDHPQRRWSALVRAAFAHSTGDPASGAGPIGEARRSGRR
jgi:hypothetical protein